MIVLAIDTLCKDLSPLLKVLGDALNVFKISLPLLLIALSIFDIGKAVISAKSDDVKKHMKSCLKKLLVCIAVFFIPMLCMVAFGFIGDFKEIEENSGIDFDICYNCMFNPNSEDCKTAVEIAELES